MDEVILECKACGAETLRPPKPEPQNGREAKQALFHCESCGAVNLRDGTLRTKRGLLKLEPSKEEKGDDFWDGVREIGLVILGAVMAVLGVKVWKDSQGGAGK